MTITISEIPLSPDNQQFNISLADTTYKMRLLWRDAAGWVMDMQDSGGNPMITGIPLVTGVDLLAQYAFMEFGFSLYVGCDSSAQEYPTKIDLGNGSHLYIVQS
nr:hypothetical protein [Rahnella aceris]